MPGRNAPGNYSYKYGFNGKENDREVTSTGSGTQDYGMRIYNPSLGKFLSVDPDAPKYPFMTPYCFAANTPIKLVDVDGAGPGPSSVARNTPYIGTAIRLYRAAKIIERLAQMGKPIVEVSKTMQFHLSELADMDLADAQKAITKSWTFPQNAQIRTDMYHAYLLSKYKGYNIVEAYALIKQARVLNAEKADKKKVEEEKKERTADDPLPRTKTGEPVKDDDAEGEHTQHGKQEGRKGPYKQAREFDKDGKPVKDIDFTDHGRPGNHTNPHEHPYIPNETG